MDTPLQAIDSHALPTKSTNHYHWIDISKGIGIILVILAHSIFPFIQQIDYFHMSLFFIVAGVTYKYKAPIDFTVAKINRIFIPYIFWSVLSGIIGLLPHGYGGSFNGPLWFLQNIFTALIIMYIVCAFRNKWQVILFLFIALVEVLIVNQHKICVGLPFNLVLAMMSFQFIWIGSRISKELISLSKRRLLIWTVFLISGFLYYCTIQYLLRTGVKGSYASLELFRENYFGTCAACCFGSIAVIAVSQLIRKSKFLEWMGKNSLVIMCVHFPFCMFLDNYLVKMPFFTSPFNKFAIAGSEYCFVILVSSILSVLCKRYIPKLTGYQNLLKSTYGVNTTQ